MRIFWPFIVVSDNGRRTTDRGVTKVVSLDYVCLPSVLFLSLLSVVCRLLLDDAGNHAGAHGTATLANGEPQLLLHRDRHDQLDGHGDVVARHHHLGAFRQMHDAGHVGGAEVELWAIVGEERRVPATLFLGE